MTGIETAILAAGTAISAIGAIQQGQNAAAASDYNARLQERNATIQRQQSQENARRQERINRKRIGSKRNALVSLDVLEDDAMEAELERLSILYEGGIGAETSQLNADLMRQRGQAGRQAGAFSAAGTLLAGAGEVGAAEGLF